MKMRLDNESKFWIAICLTCAVAGWLLVDTVELPRLEEHLTAGMVRHLVVTLLLMVTLLALGIFGWKIRRKRREAHLSSLLAVQQALDKSARRYRSLLEGAGNAIFVIDAETAALLEVNRKGIELLGYSQEEMAALAGRDLIPPEEQEKFTALVRRVKRRGRGRIDALTFRRRDGETFIGEVEARRIDLGDEQVVQAIIRNVTARHRAEREVRQRNRQLTALNNILARASEGLPLEELLDLVLVETMVLFSADGGAIHLYDEGESGLPLAARRNLPGKLAARAERSRCPAGESGQCLGLVPQLRQSCKLAGSARSEGWQSIVGIPLRAGRRQIGILHLMSRAERPYSTEEGEFLSILGAQIGMVIEHARFFTELNVKNEELEGSYRLLEKRSHQLSISQNRLKSNLALVERANLEMERLDRMKNHFLGMISHEFRTPLTGIMGSAELLLAGIAPGREGERQLLEIIQVSGERLNEIFNDILKLTRLEAKGVTLSKAPLHLADVLECLLDQFEVRLRERNLRIILHDMKGLPHFNGDRECIEDIFLELLENAIKFTRDDGTIAIAARVADRLELENRSEVLGRFDPAFADKLGDQAFFLVEVRDSGVGIPADEQLKVFDKFYEVGDIRHHSSSKHKFLGKGTGLGLAIVKGMVEAQGGMVWVESPNIDSATNPGSTFCVLLPIEEVGQQMLPYGDGETTGGQR